MLTHRPPTPGREPHVILASASSIRATMLRNAGVSFKVQTALIDEAAIREALLAEGAAATDIAADLAERKSLKVSGRFPGALVIGADQLVVLGSAILSKPDSPEDALRQLRQMSGQEHELISAAVVCAEGRPVWRHVGHARVRFHDLTDEEINGYVNRNWVTIRHAVGCYHLEGEGVRMMARIDGDCFTILGLPLLELLTWLRVRGDITA